MKVKGAKVYGIPRLGTEQQLVRAIRVPENISNEELKDIGEQIADILGIRNVKIVVE